MSLDQEREPNPSHAPGEFNVPSTTAFRQNSDPTFASTSTHHSSHPLRLQEDLQGRPPSSRNRFRTAALVPIAIQRMMKPQKKIVKNPTYMSSLRAIVTETYLSILLVFIPIGWALHFHKRDNYVAVFVTNFLAIIPLAKLLGFATEELALRVGQTIGGLLNATFGNAVELIVAIVALIKCELRVVQSSLIGSILSNLLLVLGMCFFAGGTRYSEQGFMASAAQLNSSLLTISVIAVLLPAAFHFATNQQADPDEGLDILRMSHGVAIVLLLIYAGYLFFQLWSHAHLYDEGEHAGFAEPSTAYPKNGKSLGGLAMRAIGRKKVDEEQPAQEEPKVEEEEVEEPKLNVVSAVGLLVAITVLVAFTAEYLVDSIDGLTAGGSISKEFVGLILLPIVGNAAEHVTAVTVSVKDKLDLSIGVAVGSSIQIALFVIPLLVVIAWGMGKPLTMLNDPFESVVLFLSVLVVNYVVSDGKSNWLEGFILMMLYVIIAVAFWYYPGSNPLADLGSTINLGGCTLEAAG
ncbi:Putative vacuolar cation/proton exchanger 4 [Rhizoctonia solani]|uniref:Vacuolar calcium ion transporter n=1 Tax=Rhizoctonia solani TaxID=456999 RepID=A0A0K6G053_9AGAM|nr:Putative vacuolar cation/proton exchanger 4 [Rhizoctonia solani]